MVSSHGVPDAIARQSLCGIHLALKCILKEIPHQLFCFYIYKCQLVSSGVMQRLRETNLNQRNTLLRYNYVSDAPRQLSKYCCD